MAFEAAQTPLPPSSLAAVDGSSGASETQRRSPSIIVIDSDPASPAAVPDGASSAPNDKVVPSSVVGELSEDPVEAELNRDPFEAEDLDQGPTLGLLDDAETMPASDGDAALPPTVDLPASEAIFTQDIYDPAPLAAFNLAVNHEQHFLLCSWCHVVVNPAYISSHLKQAHQVSLAPGELRALNVCIDGIRDDYSIPITMPTLPPAGTPVQPAWGGLLVHNGFRCTDCSFVSPSAPAVLSHHHQSHPGPHPSSKAFPTCKVQCIHRRATFEVLAPAVSSVDRSPSDPKALFQPILNQLKTDLLSHEVQDAREVSTWLSTTQWHIHTAPYDAKVLISLVEYPKDNLKLISAIRAYFLYYQTLLPGVDSLTLQYLNTNDPAKCVLFLSLIFSDANVSFAEE